MESEGLRSQSHGASCDLVPYKAVFRNALIRVNFEGFRAQFRDLGEKYNLREFPVPKYDGPPIEASPNFNDSEKQAVQYTMNLLPVHHLPVKVAGDRCVGAFSTHLQPFTSSLIVRPDGMILTNKEELPLFFLEVHSGREYINTVAKSVANLIDQLRLLRCFYPNVVKVSGFVFPKLPKINKEGSVIDKNLSCVTQVEVCWENFHFQVRFKVLRKDRVSDTVKHVIEDQLNQLQVEPSEVDHFFIRLLPQDLALIAAIENNSEKLKQVQSKFSIIVKSPTTYYKVLPRVEERDRMTRFIGKASLKPLSATEGIVLPTSHLHKNLQFFLFDAQDEAPLTRDDAANCLGDLVQQVAAVLERMHKLEWAHLDVRLSNICFTQDGHVRLIDLDRVHHLYDNCLDEYRGSFLYQLPYDVPITGVDWRQLGVLIYSVLHRTENPDIHKLGDGHHVEKLKQVPFLKELVVDYTMNPASFQEWKDSLESRSVHDVLRERRAREVQ